MKDKTRDLFSEQNLTPHLFQLVPDVIYALDLKGRITYLNKKFEKITGWRIKRWLGKPFQDIIHPESPSGRV